MCDRRDVWQGQVRMSAFKRSEHCSEEESIFPHNTLIKSFTDNESPAMPFLPERNVNRLSVNSSFFFQRGRQDDASSGGVKWNSRAADRRNDIPESAFHIVKGEYTSGIYAVALTSTQTHSSVCGRARSTQQSHSGKEIEIT